MALPTVGEAIEPFDPMRYLALVEEARREIGGPDLPDLPPVDDLTEETHARHVTRGCTSDERS